MIHISLETVDHLFSLLPSLESMLDVRTIVDYPVDDQPGNNYRDDRAYITHSLLVRLLTIREVSSTPPWSPHQSS
jgi:hypothetical protein